MLGPPVVSSSRCGRVDFVSIGTLKHNVTDVLLAINCNWVVLGDYQL